MANKIDFIEVDVPFCSLNYGTSPCVAALGATGDTKCFNCASTCQDPSNIDLSDETIRFSTMQHYALRSGIDAIASVQDISFDPAILSLGENLGQRSILTITFADHRHADTSGPYDKYVSERDYDPYHQGTYFGKFRARQPFLRGKSLRWIQGELGQTIDEMVTRHFIVDSIDGPFPNGTFKIVANDVLKLADSERSQAPNLSVGFLSADITDATTSISIFPVGIGDTDYPASGYVNIGGNEICSFTRTGDNLTIVRGSEGSEASAHSANDRVQLCLNYVSESPADMIYDWFVNYAGVDPSYIELSEWQEEATEFLGRLYGGTVAEPTSVNQLVSEMIEQAGLVIWWDDVDQKIRFKVLKQISDDVIVFDDQENILENSLSYSLKTSERVSQVWVYFGQRDPTKSLNDPDNYTSTERRIDESADADYGSTDIKKVFSRWVPSTGRPTAQRFADIQIARFFQPPRRFQWDLFSRSVNDVPVALADEYNLRSQPFQAADGSPDSIPVQVTSVASGLGVVAVEAEEFRFDIRGELIPNLVIIDLPTLDVNLRDLYDELYTTPDDDAVITFRVEPGGVIGSTSTATPSLILGDWPEDVTINMTIGGIIVGKGGGGGSGGGQTGGGLYFSGSSGASGGVAFNADRPVNITWDGGFIAGGGGGGGGGGASGSGTGTTGSGGGGGGGLEGGPGGPGSAAGATGTVTAGGVGGATGTSGGPGGAPGFSGGSGVSNQTSGGAGGPAGTAITEFSNITTISGTPDIRGVTSG